MKPSNTQADSIDSYIAQFPSDVQARLQQMRKAILKLTPVAMSYQIPTFKLNGNLAHFAAFKKAHWVLPGRGWDCRFSGLIGGVQRRQRLCSVSAGPSFATGFGQKNHEIRGGAEFGSTDKEGLKARLCQLPRQ